MQVDLNRADAIDEFHAHDSLRIFERAKMLDILAGILISFLFGIILTLVIEIYLFLRYVQRQPKVPIPFQPQFEKFELTKDLLKLIEKPDLYDRKETCDAINLFVQFLFKELKDTKEIRRWVIKKMNIEFEEMLQTTTGKLLEEISVLDFNLGNTFPKFRSVSVKKVKLSEDRSCMDELDVLIDIDYSGGFHLAVEADLILGKSAFLSVTVTRLKGVARLQLSRLPFTHWSFSFCEEPDMEFDVDSRFEGRPIPQLTSLIVNQIRRSVRKKHTLPNYKIRYGPFFLNQSAQTPAQDVCMLDKPLSCGSLEVTVLGCTRLMDVGSDSTLFCALGIDEAPWIDLAMKRKQLWKTYETVITRSQGQAVGLMFREEFNIDRYDTVVIIEASTTGSPASQTDIRKGDILTAVNNNKVTSEKQAVKLIKQAGDRLILRLERSSVVKSRSSWGDGSVRIDEETVRLKDIANQNSEHSEDDFINISISPTSGNSNEETRDEPLDETVTDSPTQRRRMTSFLPKTGLFQRKKGRQGAGDEVFPESGNASPRLQRKSGADCAITGPDEDVRAMGDGASSARLAVRAMGESASSGRLAGESSARPIGECASASLSANSANTEKEGPVERLEHASLGSELTADEQTPVIVDLRKTRQVRGGQDPSWDCSFKFLVENHHKYLNICVWNKVPAKCDKQNRVIKPERDLLVGHVSIPVMDIAQECLRTLQGDTQMTYNLTPPMLRAGASRAKLSKLSAHRGFEEHLCYGDITVAFCHNPGPMSKEERRKVLAEIEIQQNKEKEQKKPSFQKVPSQVSISSQESKTALEGGHNFELVQFQAATHCHFCAKKIWLKTAFQCLDCTMICHKKCVQKCQAQITCPRNGIPPIIPRPVVSKTMVKSRSGEGRPLKEAILSKLRRKPATAVGKEHNQGKDIDPFLDDSSRSQKQILSETETRSIQERARAIHRSFEDGDTTPLAMSDIKPHYRSILKESGHGLSLKIDGDSDEDDSTDTDSEDEANLVKFLQKNRKSQQRDEQVVTKAKEMGKELYSNLEASERKVKLDAMVTKFQQEIDLEIENRTELNRLERECAFPEQKTQIKVKITNSDEKIQALAYLMLHYCAGLQHCLDQEEEERQKRREVQQDIEEPTDDI